MFAQRMDDLLGVNWISCFLLGSPVSCITTTPLEYLLISGLSSWSVSPDYHFVASTTIPLAASPVSFSHLETLVCNGDTLISLPSAEYVRSKSNDKAEGGIRSSAVWILMVDPYGGSLRLRWILTECPVMFFRFADTRSLSRRVCRKSRVF